MLDSWGYTLNVYVYNKPEWYSIYNKPSNMSHIILTASMLSPIMSDLTYMPGILSSMSFFMCPMLKKKQQVSPEIQRSKTDLVPDHLCIRFKIANALCSSSDILIEVYPKPLQWES